MKYGEYERKKKFFDNVLPHDLIKEVLSCMLQLSGYRVLPYGYEMTLSGLIEELKIIPKNRTGTIKRIRKSPDLLIYDEGTEKLMLVEIKMRNAPSEKRVLIGKEEIGAYQNYWKDAIIVIAIPHGDVFYAQKVSRLNKEKEYFDATKDFLRFGEVFDRVRPSDLEYYRELACRMMNAFYSLNH